MAHPASVSISPSLTLTVLRSWSEVGAIQTDWQSLAEADSSAMLYQTWEWNRAWMSAFGRRKRPFVITVREGERLVGLAPFYTSRHLGLPLRRLAWMGTGVSDYLDLLCLPERQEEVIRAILDMLRTQSGWDGADLQQCRPGSHIRSALSIPEPDLEWRQQEPCPYLDLPETVEAFQASLSKKMRSNLSYYRRLFEREVEGASLTLATQNNLDAAMQALFDLHQARWKSRGLPGVMGGQLIRAFHLEAAREFARQDRLRLHLAHAQGRIVGALYCYHFRQRCCYYLGGFDPALGRYSIGTILTHQAIHTALQDGCRTFDFLRGAEPYKYRWQPKEEFNARLLIGRAGSVKSKALRSFVGMEERVEHRLKALAENRGRRGKQ